MRLALARLADQGVVHAEQRSTAVYYTANRDHLAWPAVESLTAMRSTLIQRIRDELSTWRPAPLHASLFGSAARGDADSASDIDVLIIRPDDVAEDDPSWDEHVDRLRQHVDRWTGNRCHAFEIDRHRLGEHVEAKDPLVDSWLRDEIRLAGDDLHAVVRHLPIEGGKR
ncbi:nucleotidyltransferase domain-containing protein [Mycobacterium sp. NPDC003449]